MAFDDSIREEELKNQVASTIFFGYDCDRIIGNIDFCVGPHVKRAEPTGGGAGSLEGLEVYPLGPPSFVWAEAKRGRANLTHALIQLVLTVGKARTFNRYDPPKYLAAFDAHAITLVPFGEVYPVYQLNDFNWNATASDHGTEEFRRLEELLGETLAEHRMTFRWEDGGLKTFIRQNFVYGGPTVRLAIDRHNFITVYSRWREVVMPLIAASWADEQAEGIIDADFYLADLLSAENQTILQKLKVLLQHDRYRLAVGMTKTKKLTYTDYEFKPGGRATHRAFWNAYERPPDTVYWDYIIERRDLLVPGDVREVKGAFFTPERWVKLSQAYLAEHLGPNWQQEYYVWDCAAGTGNLLAGLTNPQNVWASTLDQADVDVMHQLIAKNSQAKGAPPQLFTNHVFQFDFLNDEFSQLPAELRGILEDPEKRRRLVMYINPPYAEAGTTRQRTGTGTNKTGVAKQTMVSQRYRQELGNARNELFAQFFIRIYKEIPSCLIGEFSTLKILQSSNFKVFRNHFRAKLEKNFFVPADTFDNVKGQFPIGFFLWDTSQQVRFESTVARVYDRNGEFLTEKRLDSHDGRRYINDWIRQFYDETGRSVGKLRTRRGNDFQNNSTIFLTAREAKSDTSETKINLTADNVLPCCTYLAVRLCMRATWLNDRDQFLWPSDGWLSDPEFQSDCLAFTLLHGQNRISCQEGRNCWIPFREGAVGITHAYSSHFMVDFLDGRLPAPEATASNLFTANGTTTVGDATHAPTEPWQHRPHGYPTGQTPIRFSPEAQALLDAGLALWRYYHSQPGAEVNASYYDIRRHFQGVNEKGRMNARSEDAEYMRLVEAIRERGNALGEKIAMKVYEYGFLLG